MLPYTFKNIMIVDDNEIDRFIHRKLLEHYNFADNVIEVDNGWDALDKLRDMNKAGQSFVDLVLLDIMMPEMDGFDFLNHYQNFMHQLKHVPKIVMISSTENDNDLKKAKRSPYILKLLKKPLNPAMLRELF